MTGSVRYRASEASAGAPVDTQPRTTLVPDHPRPALEQHPAGAAGTRADRHAGVPAAALRAAAWPRVSRLPWSDALAIRARARHVPSRAARAGAPRGAT